MSEPIVKVVHPAVVETFHSNHKSTSWWQQRKSQGITKVSRIHPLGTMDVCNKFHGNLLVHPTVAEKFHTKNTNVKCEEEKSADHQHH